MTTTNRTQCSPLTRAQTLQRDQEARAAVTGVLVRQGAMTPAQARELTEPTVSRQDVALARDIARAARGTPAAGLADRLARAMEESARTTAR